MGFKCGIVGLPNVGKSTIFNALTSAKAEAANYPFCTIEPNTGIVRVPDPRLEDIAKYIPPQTLIPTTMTFVDIAGLVKGASKGEGLGNQFLGHIRETQAIAHVVRCFEDGDVTHVDGSVDPIRDVSVIDTELMLCDLDLVEKKHKANEKPARSGNKEAAKLFGVLEPVKSALEAGQPVRALNMQDEQLQILNELHLLTQKKVVYVANVGESDLGALEQNPHYVKLRDHAAAEGAPIIAICGKIESELSELDMDAKREFMADMGMEEPGLNAVIREGYRILGLQTYFTAGEKEVRAWTFEKGWKAPQAAGVIHTDFEKGFIKAEVFTYDDLMKHKSEGAVREAGALKLQGKEYVVQDGDIMHFRFAV